MISLQKLFGKTDVFYTLLKQSAAEAQRSVQALKPLFSRPPQADSLDAFRAARRKDKEITEQINEALCKTFVTELEREDVENLSVALYKIPKTVEKIAERYIISQDRLGSHDFTTQIGLMESASSIVVEMVDELCLRMHLEEMKGKNAKLQQVEGDADKLMVELLRELYHKETDAVRVVILRDLYDLMEKVVDKCRDAGNVLSHIVLKYA
jgi:hypothetical protein